MKIKVAEASATQLAKFASVHFGIDVAPQKGKENIVKLLADVGFNADEFDDGVPEPYRGTSSEGLLDPVVAAPQINADTVAPARASKTRRMVSITIMEQDTPGSSEGKEPVKVSVNGSCMFVPRGKPVEIPYEYYHVLQNATFRQFDTPPDEYTALGEARLVPRFPITVHSIDPEPAKAAIAA